MLIMVIMVVMRIMVVVKLVIRMVIWLNDYFLTYKQSEYHFSFKYLYSLLDIKYLIIVMYLFINMFF